MEDLTTLIEDSITDVELPTPDLDSPEVTLEASSDPVETTDPTPLEEVQSTEPEAPLELGKPVQDDFDKKFGLTSQSSSGRENRIPYSRVKKITEKAVADAKTEWQKETQSGYVPSAKYQELDTKVKDYEGRLTKVGEFESVMTKEPVKFLQFLNGIPGYAQIFDQLKGAAAQAQAPQQPVTVPDEAPQPDQQLSDGSMVYSMEGLAALRAYDRKQTEASVIKLIEARYAPLENDYKAHQRTQQALPLVQQQITEARQWPQFSENEDDIAKCLAANKNFSLERAYQTVVYPKLKAEQERLVGEAKVNREAIRAEVLRELKTAPRATSTSTGATRPAQAAPSSGPRSLEDVIADSLKVLR